MFCKRSDFSFLSFGKFFLKKQSDEEIVQAVRASLEQHHPHIPDYHENEDDFPLTIGGDNFFFFFLARFFLNCAQRRGE